MKQFGSKYLGILAAMAIMGGETMPDIEPDKIDTSPKPLPIPKGCKQYWFNASGDFYNGDGTKPILRTEVVFNCVASSDKSAKRKFDNWNKNN